MVVSTGCWQEYTLWENEWEWVCEEGYGVVNAMTKMGTMHDSSRWVPLYSIIDITLTWPAWLKILALSLFHPIFRLFCRIHSTSMLVWPRPLLVVFLRNTDVTQARFVRFGSLHFRVNHSESKDHWHTCIYTPPYIIGPQFFHCFVYFFLVNRSLTCPPPSYALGDFVTH